MTNYLKNQDLKIDIVNNMKKYGGSFIQDLADLITTADGDNLQKIEATWPEYIKKYLPQPWQKGGK